MIIKRLSASFGRLSGDTLELKDGLNIIEAPNECGKSTWSAFIRAMLYGLRSDRDKQGYLSDKTRYRPWTGAAMEGSMVLESGGRSITIERASAGRLPMKEFRAVYTGTGVTIDALTPDGAGELLFGVSQDVFERSVFISQSGIKIGQTPELEKRISALVSTGDEASSYTEADERLRLWQRKRRFNKSGTIPALEEKLNAQSKRLAAIEAAQDMTADMRLEAERLKKIQSELTAELQSAERYEARLAYMRAREKLHKAKAAYDGIDAELTRNGPAPSVMDIAAIRGDTNALGPLRKMLSDEERRQDNARENYETLLRRKKQSAFNETDAGSAFDQAAALGHKIKRLGFRNPLTIIPAILFAAAGAASALMEPIRLYAAAASLVFLLIVILRTLLRASAAAKLTRHLSAFGADSVEELEKLRHEDAELQAAIASAESDVRASEKSAAAASEAYNALLQTLTGRLKALSLDTDLNAVEPALTRAEALLSRLSSAKSEMAAAESFLKAVEDSGAYSAGDDTADDAAPPKRPRQEITAELHGVTARLEELSGRYNMALGEIRALGDPAVLGSEIQTDAAELAQQKMQYDALSLAIDSLKEASAELQTRFSPLLSDTAGRIVRHLTGGRYEKLSFDKALDAAAKTAGETVSRNILSLSAGTADQIYLALRLAIVELILPDENPCPLILDDVLSNFDDGRAALALDYLKQLSTKRQILLFTCHGREGAHFQGDCEVNLICYK